MYKCDNPRCGAEFEEPATRKEYHTEIEGDYYELFNCCPCCGCDEYSEIEDEDEDEEIEDDEKEIPSFNFVVVVRNASHLGYMKNFIFYAPTFAEAEKLVEKYSRYKTVRVIRVFELRSEVRL